MTPSRTRKASGRLQKFIAAQPPSAGQLPFVHITRAYRFDDILTGDELEPSYCGVFKEDLIYFFYGRPAYRAKDGNNARLEFEWPIVFIFDPTKIPDIKRIFPFDSGAFADRIYEEFFDPNSQIMDFSLQPDVETPAKVVGTFYQNHEEYYSGESRRNVNIPQRQFEAQGIHELSRLPGVQGTQTRHRLRDERSSAIEIQVGRTVSLKDALLAIVLPEPYLGDAEIQQALSRWNVAEIHTYATLHNLGGEAWVGQIYGLVRNIYKKLGFLT